MCKWIAWEDGLYRYVCDDGTVLMESWLLPDDCGEQYKKGWTNDDLVLGSLVLPHVRSKRVFITSD